MIAELPPAFILLFGALLVPFLPGRLRAVYVLLLPVLSCYYLFTLAAPIRGGAESVEFLRIPIFEYTLTCVRIDQLSLLFGYIFHIALFIGLVFALHVRGALQHITALMYAGSALGAVFAGDLITLFIFWELLALTSAFLIWSRRTRRSYAAGMRYLIVQIASGVILLAGIVLHGSIEFNGVLAETLGSKLILFAFGIKCAFPLLHNWLTDAYPEATPSGAVFLSAFTTKLAVYALARGFAGNEGLIYIGAAMTAFPIFYAVIENDLRRVLAYSLINQVGFMVCGIGIGTELAVNGAVSHAFVHIIYKGLLFMSMGAVLYRTGKINGSDLGGLYKSMPKTAGLCMVGAASISAFPLFSGFVSKSMVMQAALDEGHDWVWLILLFASAGVFHHAGIKIPFFAFFARDSGIRCREAPTHMLIAMGIAAALCVFYGCFPGVFLYRLLPFPVDYVPYTATHVISQLQLLFFAAVAFCWLKLSGIYPPELRSVNLDTDWVYRRAAPRLIGLVARSSRALGDRLGQIAGRLGEIIRDVAYGLARPEGILARSWTLGSSLLWVLLFLAVYLILNYVRA